MSVTVTAIWNRFVDETQIGFHGTGTFAATTLTDTTELQNTNFHGNELRGWWLGYLDSATAADRAKAIKSNGLVGSTGVVTHAGSSISATGASKNYSITRPDWHPVRYGIPLINRSLEIAWQWWRTVLTPVTDGDMETSGVTNWAATNSTRVKATTVVWQGQQALEVTNTAANGYVQSAAFQAAPNRSFRLTAKVYATTGVPFMAMYDYSNSAVIATATLTGPAGGNAWRDIMLTGTFPATCDRAAIRLGGVAATAVSVWDDVTPYWDLMQAVTLPSWLTQWRTESGEPAARLYYQRNRLGTNDDWPARSYDLALVDPTEYQILNQPTAVNSLQVELSRKLSSYSMWPLIIEARRPFSDFGVVDDGADTTTCPIRLVVAGMKRLAANDRGSKHADREFGGDDAYKTEWLREQMRVASQLNIPAPDQHGMSVQELR